MFSEFANAVIDYAETVGFGAIVLTSICAIVYGVIKVITILRQ